MKKILSLLLALCFILPLSACGSKSVPYSVPGDLPEGTAALQLVKKGQTDGKEEFFLDCQPLDENMNALSQQTFRFPLAADFTAEFWEPGVEGAPDALRYGSADDFITNAHWVEGKVPGVALLFEFSPDNQLIRMADTLPASLDPKAVLGAWEFVGGFDADGNMVAPNPAWLSVYEDGTYITYNSIGNIKKFGKWNISHETLSLPEASLSLTLQEDGSLESTSGDLLISGQLPDFRAIAAAICGPRSP